VAEPKPAGVLSLARAFQLMTDALAEFRGPVAQGPLRLRMVAMHGREDPLLDAARFSRLLRQANDAEVADVRQVGDDDFEVTPRRRADGRSTAATSHRAVSAPAASPAGSAAPPAAVGEEASTEASGESVPAPSASVASPKAAESRESGPRRGVRFRRGSRGPSRLGDVPLVGVVRNEAAASAEAPAPAAPPSDAEPKSTEKAARRPRAKSAKAAKPAEGAKAAERPKAKRPARPRVAKKAE
jgi:hypothetical protein